MSAGADLTRWNRAGLSRLRYVDGNAATYLEELRAALADRFPAPLWAALQQNRPPEPAAEETEAETIERLLTQYQGERGDWGWEIVRALARSCHVLTEYLDVYANEGYLGTATQWDNVRRLVEMLDYSPAPPASAETVLVLAAKEDESGKVAKGFQVKYTPPEGGAPVIFETLEEVEVDDGLNALRLAGYKRSPDRVSGATLKLEEVVKDLVIGQPVVVENETTKSLEARFLTGVVVGETTTTITLHQPLLRTSSFCEGSTRVHLEPADRLAPCGPVAGGAEIERTLQLRDEPSTLAPGQTVYVDDGVDPRYRRVKAVRGRRLLFYRDVGPLRLDDAWVSGAQTISVRSLGGRTTATVDGENVKIFAVRTAGDLSRLVGAWVADLRTRSGIKELVRCKVFAASYRPVDPAAPETGGYTSLRLIDREGRLENPQALYVPPVSGQFQADPHLEKDDRNPLPLDLETEASKKTSAGDLVVATSGRQLAWARLTNVGLDKEKDRATLSVAKWRQRGGGLYFPSATTVYGHFKSAVRLAGWKQNPTAVAGAWLRFDGARPAALAEGSALLIEQQGSAGVEATFETEVAKISGNAMQVDPALPANIFTVEGTVIRGNLVRAGHGESQPVKVLGSGDATRTGQSFVLEKEGVSFVADPTQPNGVRPDVELTVGDRVWQLVPNLRDSQPADPHYAVRMTEEGYLRFTFGDGRRGRRLPTGSNNVRVRYRVGSGLAGNLAAGSLTKAVKPHPYVEGVAQPRAAAGGNDMESVDSLRQNAPSTVLTLERAVSLTDFAHLATRQSSVWQARAFPLPTGFRWRENVEVVVVPAEGKPLGALQATLEDYLGKHALPGVAVRVTDFDPAPFDLRVTARIKSAEYEPAKVLAKVREALATAFSLLRRRLGQDLFVSEVYKVVEGVEGVENSDCAIDGDASLRRLEASDRQVLYLDPRSSSLVSIYEEYEL